MKENQNYKLKLEAVLELLKSEEHSELLDAALDIYNKNYITMKELEYILSSNENTLTLDQNDIHYSVVLYKGTPHILIGLQGSLILIPCTSFSDENVYEMNFYEAKTLNHEDLRMLISDTEEYRNYIHKIVGEYELDMVITDHAGTYGDFDDI